MEVLILSIALAFNLIIIIWKFRNNRTLDGLVDSALLTTVALVFSGSTMLLSVGTLGSMLVSLYLLASPVRFNYERA